MPGDNIMSVSESVSFKKIKHKKKKLTKDKVLRIFIYAFFAAFIVVTLYPLFHLLALSFNDSYDSRIAVIRLIPHQWSLENYKKLLLGSYTNFRRGILVSLIRTVIGTSTALISSAFLAYILSRKRFLFKKGLSIFWFITMYAQGGIVPTLILYRNLNLTGTFWVYIIPYMISVFNVFVMKTYMQGIPYSFEEAAQLEGAGYLKIFWHITAPICKPVFAVTALFVAAAQWNSWFDAWIYNRFESKYTTLFFELMKFYSTVSAPKDAVMITFKNNPTTPETLKAAGCILGMLPLVIAYPFFQKFFVEGITIGGVKE